MFDGVKILIYTNEKRGLLDRIKELQSNPYLFVLIIIVLLSLLLFSVYPIYSILKTIFVSDGSLDLQSVIKAFNRPLLFKTIWNSLKLGIFSAILSTFIGFVFAYSVTRTNMVGKPFFNFVAVFPVVSDRKSTRLNSSHVAISYAVFCLK